MENNINNSNCPTMQYHNRLTEEQRDKLGSKYIAEGTTVKDSKTGIVSDIVSIEHNGFKASQQSSLDGFPKSEFFIPFEEIVDKHGRGIIEIGGYENTEPDHKLLILVVKDIMACNIIRDKENAIQEKENIIEDHKSALQDHIQDKNNEIEARESIIAEKDGEIQKLNGILDNEKVEEVALTEEMARGGIIGEVKANPVGIIKEVRDVNGKILREVYVGDTLYRRNGVYGTYNSLNNELLYRSDSQRIHMAYGGIVGVVEKKNYYFVDISSPENAKTCRIPKWSQNVAESVKKGAKVTTCKKYNKWFTSSVMVPKDGITSNEAKHIAAEIRDKMEHRKMENGGTMYETGATSFKVNNLLLFAENTGNLVDMKNAVYNRIKNNRQELTPYLLAARFRPYMIKVRSQYVQEMGNTPDILEETKLSPEEELQFMNITLDDSSSRMESGGKMEEDSDRVAAHKYWDGLTKKQKLHFLLDHADYVYDKPASKLEASVLRDYKKQSSIGWSKLPKEIQMAIEEHVIMGVYETGGEISGYTPLNEEQSKQLIGDDVDSTVKGILVMIECSDDEDEKAQLRKQLKEYDYQAN